MKAWVLWWCYSDGSSAGVERVYLDEKRANEDFVLASGRTGSVDYKLTEVPVYGEEI